MKAYTKITLWYLGFGILWIFFSDRIFEQIASSIEHLTYLQTVKGWLFVILSAVLIFYISKKSFDQIIRKEAEKRSIFKGTLKGAYHILLNYLNQMQLMTLEAEGCRDFDSTILELAKANTEEAKKALLKLDQIDNITEEAIEKAVFGHSHDLENNTG